MRSPAAAILLAALLSACTPAHAWLRGGHAGPEAQLVVMAIDTLALDEQPSQGPLCEPTVSTCPYKAPAPQP
jgi:hypothetical protein